MLHIKSGLRTVVVGMGFFLPSLAIADTIEYSTSGYFGTVGTTSVSSGSESLTYNGLSNVFVNTPSTVSFGNFIPTFGTAGSIGSFNNDTFTLVITELDNGVSSNQSIVGTLSGALRVSSAGSPSSNVFVNFGVQTVSFTESNGNIATYQPFSTPVSTTTTTIQGSVDSAPPAVTPIPKSAFSIAGLLGFIGLTRATRRNVTA